MDSLKPASSEGDVEHCVRFAASAFAWPLATNCRAVDIAFYSERAPWGWIAQQPAHDNTIKKIEFINNILPPQPACVFTSGAL